VKFNVAIISVDMCSVHNNKFVATPLNVTGQQLTSMVLTGNNMQIAMKCGINTTLVALKMEISLSFTL